MIKISLRTNFPEVARRLEQLPDDIANKAMARALNKTVEQGRADMARAISDEYRVGVTAAKKRLNVERARFRGELKLWASLQATKAGGLYGNDERGMNLIHFMTGGVPRRTKKGAMRQISFQIKRSGGRKQIKGAFVAANKRTGGTAIFIREGKGRMPIKTLTTIDVAQMFNTKRINLVIRQTMQAKFAANFNRELKAVLQGWVK